MGALVPVVLGLFVATAIEPGPKPGSSDAARAETRAEKRARKKAERKNKRKGKAKRRRMSRKDKSLYEMRRINELIREENLSIDEAPEGKRIAWVRIQREQVFRKGELFPVFFNKLHVLTRERIVKRELLFKETDSYADVRIEESMRNLRGMGIFAFVRIVPVALENPDEVGVLVYTRDLWSLRIEQSFNITNRLNALKITLVERNVAGLDHTASIPFRLWPDRWSITQTYGTRRTFNRPFSVGESGGLIFNREHGNLEGGSFGVSAGRPFYNLAQHVAWSVGGGYDTRVRRQIVDGESQTWIPEGEEEVAGLRVWRQRSWNAAAGISLRGGDKARHTLSFSFGGSERMVAMIDEAGVDPALHDQFLLEVPPVARREIGPSFGYDLFFPKFKVFTNLNTFGQSENVRLGPTFGFGISTPIRALGSTQEALIASVGASYTWSPGRWAIRLSGSARGRWQEHTDWVDQVASASLRGFSPMFGPFRFTARVAITKRWNDTTNGQVSLGANNGLRGFPSQHLVDYGASSMMFSAELRTKPLEWRALHVGGVLFYNTGSVFQNIYTAKLSHGFGIGIRVLLPQINRSPWTLDGGFSVDPFRFVPTFKSGQVMSAI